MPSSPAIGARPGYTLPQRNVRIDWSHPLAVGLNDYFLCDRPVPLELVSRQPPNLRSNPGTMTGIYGGVGVNMAAGGFAYSPAAKPFVAPPFTAHVVFRRNTESNFQTLIASGGVSTTLGWTWTAGPSGQGFYLTFGGVAGYQFVGSLPAGRRITAGTVVVSGTTATCYRDSGAHVSSLTVGTPSTAVGITTALGICGGAGGGFVDPNDGEIAVAAIWRRALSAAEVMALHADPFCMLRQ